MTDRVHTYDSEVVAQLNPCFQPKVCEQLGSNHWILSSKPGTERLFHWVVIFEGVEYEIDNDVAGRWLGIRCPP